MTSTTENRKPGEHEHEQHDHDHNHKRHVVVTVAAPNNVSREVEVDLHDRVDKVARDAVHAFVHAQQMESMACGLALVVSGTARLLDDTARLQESDVQAHARLVLVPKRPKTDG